MLPFALLAFFFIVLGGEREGARAASCDTGFFQRGVLDPAPPPSALLPPRSRKVERFGSSNAIEEETTRNWRQRSSGEKCERKKAKGAMSPALFFFPSHPTLETLNPLKHPPKNKNKNRTPKPAPRPSAPSRPWERTPCSATLLQCSWEERLREDQLGPPPREEQPRRARGPPAAPRGLAPPEEQRWER